MLPLLATTVCALVLTAVVVLALLYLRLTYGPIALDFLSRPIERAIAEELAGPRVEVGGVALALNDRGLFQFELKKVRVSDAGGETLVAAPAVAVSFSRTALLSGRIAVEGLDLIAARLVLFYAEDGTLSLKFSPEPEKRETGTAGPPARPAVRSAPAVAPPPGTGGVPGRIDLVKALAEVSARAHRGGNASAYLREIGLRSATIVIDNGRHKTTWRVAEFDLDLDHHRTRSLVAGRAKVESAAGPWELTFRTDQRIGAEALNLSLSVRGLVPGALAPAFPHLPALEGFDVPVSGEAQLQLSGAGEILGGKLAIEASAGSLSLPGPSPTAVRIGGGRFELTYDAAARSFAIGPSSLSWAGGHVRFSGAITHAAQEAGGSRWKFDIASTEGSVGAGAGTAPLPIDRLAARGYLAPQHGRVVLQQLVMRIGGTDVSAKGEMAGVGGTVQARIDGSIGAMPVGRLKTLWPSWLAPATRTWVSPRLARGKVERGTFKLARGAAPVRSTSGGWTTASDGDRLTLTLEGADLEFAPVDGWPAIEMARALLRIEGPTVEFTTPEASLTAADGRKFSLKGTFSVDLNRPMPRMGTLALKGEGPLSLAVEILEREAPHLLKDSGLALSGSDGNLDGSLSINLPLTPQLDLRDVAVQGRLRVSDAKIGPAFGTLEVQGINVDVDISTAAIEAKGKFLAGNVPATVNWQYVFGAPADKQPPLRITTVLYDNERAELGLKINDLVQGEVGAEITITQDAKGGRHMHVRADLTNAVLKLEGLAWHKPVGKRGVFEFDVVKGSKYPIELHNVRLDGENVAIAGWMGAGSDFRIREYRFPHFSLNVVSNFEAYGKLRADNVWQVTARGATYDGRDHFRSFFFNPLPEKRDKDRPGLDLRADFETVLGYFETSLRNVRISMRRRAGTLIELDARGILPDNKQFEVSVDPRPRGPRVLVAKSNDAGKVFKLVGFVPHAVGGDMSLEINLDGRGAAERTGVLSATRFHLLGDAVTVENFPGSGPGSPRRVVREKVPFDVLRAPFSVGHGQFVLRDARIEGPVASATMTGRIDFKTKRLHVVGTFTPVAALNQVLRDIPLVGDIMTGPKREGVFAWNYALQGGLENPQLIVNPLSGVAPGFTREFFPIIPEEPSAAPRKRSRSGRSGRGARASSSPAAGPGADGWLSEMDKATGKSPGP